MSALKSSLYYLQDIINFLNKKQKQYVQIESYTASLQSNEEEVKEFLKNVLVNIKNYGLVRNGYEHSQKSKNANYLTIKIFSIIAYIIFTFTILVYGVKKVKEKGPTFLNKSKMLMFYSIVIVVSTVLFVLLIKNLQWAIRDSRVSPPTDNVAAEFTIFNDAFVIAMYFASINQLGTVKRNQDKKVKKLYKLVSEKRDKIEYPKTLKTMMQMQQWQNYVSKISAPIKRIVQKTDDLETALQQTDDTKLIRDVQTSATYLMGIVKYSPQNRTNFDPKMMTSILNNEIIPIVAQSKEIYELKGVSFEQPSESAVVTETDNKFECLFNCAISDKCLVAAFEVPSRKCYMDSNKLYQGQALIRGDNENVIYTKKKPELSAFTKGTLPSHVSMISDPQKIALPTEGWVDDQGKANLEKINWCRDQCLSKPDCVRYQTNIDQGECNIFSKSSKDPLQLKETTADCTRETCNFVKTELAKSVSPSASFEEASPVMEKMLLQILKKYNFQFKITSYKQHIKKALEMKYTNKAELDKVYEKVSILLSNVQSKADAVPKAASNKFMSPDEFIADFDKMKYFDLLYLQHNVKQLNDATSELHRRVQESLSMGTASKRNLYISTVRSLDNFKTLLVGIVFVMVMGYIYYILPAEAKKGGAGDLTDLLGDEMANKIIKFIMPPLGIIFTIILLVSYYLKAKAVSVFNREILEKNGSDLATNIDELNTKLDTMVKNIKKDYAGASFNTLVETFKIDTKTKQDIYTVFTNALTVYDKCNLILEGSEIGLQFPWIDVIVNGSLVIICLLIIGFVWLKIDPYGKLTAIRHFTKVKNKLTDHKPVDGLLKDLEFESSDDESITAALKYVGIIVIILIMILLSMRLIQSSQSYKFGLYNSNYYINSQCTK
jgi:hypothetical protein